MSNEKKIKQKINNSICQLQYRVNQASYSKKNIKYYYHSQASNIRQNIRDLEAQLIYDRNKNDNHLIDLHGATRYFIDTYLEDLLFYKYQFYNDIIIMTGKGSRTLYNHLHKYLIKEKYQFKIKDSKFHIQLE